MAMTQFDMLKTIQVCRICVWKVSSWTCYSVASYLVL